MKFKLEQNGASEFPWLGGIQRLAKCNMLPTTSFLNKKIKVLQRSDKLVKTIVCIQVSWLIIQAIARKIEELPVTLLELNTIAQVWVALFIYALWWFKPQGIADIIEIDFSHCQQCQKQLREHGITMSTPFFCATSVEHWRRQRIVNVSLLLGLIPIVSAVYLTIDALGWTAYFPTRAERIIWHVSICMFATGTMLLPVATFLSYMDHPRVADVVGVCAVSAGVLGRVVLTIEAFISIRSLPVGPSWSDFIPHIG